MLDLKIFNFIHQLVGKSRLLDFLAVFFADYIGYILIAVVVFLIFSNKKIKTRFYNLSFIALAILLSRGILTETIRFFYNKQRPFVELGFTPLINHDSNYAFPSGHMTFYFAIVFSLYYLGYKRWAYIFMTVCAVMGLARIYAGAHWPLDIVGGILIAFVSVFIVKWLLATTKKE